MLFVRLPKKRPNRNDDERPRRPSAWKHSVSRMMLVVPKQMLPTEPKPQNSTVVGGGLQRRILS